MTHLSEHELIDYLIRELPPGLAGADGFFSNNQSRSDRHHLADPVDERSELLPDRPSRTTQRPHFPETSLHYRSSRTRWPADETSENDFSSSFVGLNALEIAAVADAKKFLSQRLVQKIVNGIWCGDIVFWEVLSVHATKKAQLYNKR